MRITHTSPVLKKSNKSGFTRKLDGSVTHSGSVRWSGSEMRSGRQDRKPDSVLDRGNLTGKSAVLQCEVHKSLRFHGFFPTEWTSKERHLFFVKYWTNVNKTPPDLNLGK